MYPSIGPSATTDTHRFSPQARPFPLSTMLNYLRVVEIPSESRDFIARILSVDASIIVWMFIIGKEYLLFFICAYFGFYLHVSENPPLEEIRSVGYYKRKIRIAIIGSILYIISHVIILNSLDLSGWVSYFQSFENIWSIYNKLQTYYTIYCLLNVFYPVFYIRYTWKVVEFSGFNLKYGYGIGPVIFGIIAIVVLFYQISGMIVDFKLWRRVSPNLAKL